MFPPPSCNVVGVGEMNSPHNPLPLVPSGRDGLGGMRAIEKGNPAPHHLPAFGRLYFASYASNTVQLALVVWMRVILTTRHEGGRIGPTP